MLDVLRNIPEPYLFRQIRARLDTITIGRSSLVEVLGRLTAQRLIVRVTEGGEHRYRLSRDGDDAGPPVRSIPVPGPLDAVALRRKVEALLASGMSYDETELLRSVSLEFPQCNAPALIAVLVGLVEAGKVTTADLGSRRRYRLLDASR